MVAPSIALDESGLLFELILLLALTATGLALFERLGLPAIAGFLVVGALAGPGALGLVADPERVRALAEMGVIFLLFEIGLELPIERLRELGKTALLAGGSQVLLTIALVAAAASLVGLPGPTAWILGGLVAMSSTALVMRILADEGQIEAPHGQLAIAVLVFQDLAIVPLLLAIPFLAGGSDQGASDLLLSIGRMIGGLALVLLILRFGVPRLLNRVAEARSPDLFSLLALLLVLGSAFLAEELGLTLAVGAFLAGVAASSSPYAQQLFSEVVPLRGVILGIFFTAVGMLFEPTVLLEHGALVVLYLVTTLVLKTAIVALAGPVLIQSSLRVSLLAGLVLSQTGEFSFVLAEAARQADLLSESLYQVVLAGSIFSLLLSPFVIRIAPGLSDSVARWWEGRLAHEESEPAAETREVPRVIMIGYGPAGQTLTRLLRAIEIPYRVIDANARSVRAAQDHDPAVFFGDATRPTVLRHLGVENARLVVVAISDPLATRRIVSRLRLLAPDVPILARTRFVREVDPLDAAGASTVVAEEFEGSIELVARSLDLFGIPAGAIARFTEALREEGYGAIRSPAALPLDPWLIELLDEVGTEWVDVPEGLEAATTLVGLNVRAHTGCSVLAVDRDGRSVANPEPGFVLAGGDRLLVMGDSASLSALRQVLEDASAGH
ncbi:MAG: hypothetical protein CBC48_04860 [bacterium TMED88]|nr:hypothetical protein [Deltaproteobacteria bacterium]OUV35008.1 MAG: hypothetical protein CBC48_04860 [bacterium TMED88]